MFCIPVYFGSNAHICCTSFNLSLLVPSMSSLSYPFSLRGHQSPKRNFFSLALLLACMGHIQTILNESLLFYHLLLIPPNAPQCAPSDSIFPSFTTHSSQHSHLCYTHSLHVLFPNWPTFCVIGYNWSSHFLESFRFNFIGMC